jgi:hypothetical protein
MTAGLSLLVVQHANGVLGTGLVGIFDRAAFDAAEGGALVASVGLHEAFLSLGAAAVGAQAVLADDMGAE